METGRLKKFEHPFTITPNAIVNDTRLSAADKGVALVICSKPNGWVFHTSEIIKTCGGGTYVVKNALIKLEKLGYISRSRATGSDGKYTGINIEIREKPVEQEEQDEITHEVKNPRMQKTVRGLNSPYSNTYLSSNTDFIKKDTPKSPQGDVLDLKVETHVSPSKNDERFEEFWKAFPKCERKIGKAKCRELWIKRNLDTHADAILKAIAIDANSHDWKKDNGQFIPMPQTWLNRKRYEDIEPSSPESAAPSSRSPARWAAYTSADTEREHEFIDWVSGGRKSPPPPWSVHTDEWVSQNKENIIQGFRI